MARKQWLMRNADVGTIETRDELDDLGSDAPGVGGFRIPTWAHYITRISASGALDGAAIGNGVVIGYLEGGLDNGDSQVNFMIAGGGVQVATGTQNAMNPWLSPPLAIPVVPGARLKVFAEIFGDAENDSEVEIAVQVSDSPEEGGCKWTRSFTADVDGIDADTNLTGAFGSNAAPETQIPKEAIELAYVSTAFGYDQGADGTNAIMVHIKAGVIEDEQHISCGAMGSIAGQAGSDEGAILLAAFNTSIESKADGGRDLSGQVRGEQLGDDLGSGQIGVTLWFR